MTKHLQPRLRFEGFEEEWKVEKLGAIATFKKGKGIAKKDIVEEGKTACIRYGELYTHYGTVISTVQSSTNTATENLVLSQANDVLIPASGETAIDIATASCVLVDNVILGGDLNIIRPTVNGVFLAYYLSHQKKIQIAQLAQGVQVIHLYNRQLQHLEVALPTAAEQQKIANFFSVFDKKITLLERKKQQLNLLKKGIMRRLLTGKVRFKEFIQEAGSKKTKLGNRPKDWTILKLGAVFKLKSGKGLSKSATNEGTIPVYGGNGVNGYHDCYNYVSSKIIIGRVGSKCGCIHKTPAKAWVTDNALVVDHKLVAYEDDFMVYQLQQLHLNNFANKNAQPVISGKRIYGLRIALPPLAEQQKIAEYLCKMAVQIQRVQAQIDATKAHKKGLLQQLLV